MPCQSVALFVPAVRTCSMQTSSYTQKSGPNWRTSSLSALAKFSGGSVTLIPLAALILLLYVSLASTHKRKKLMRHIFLMKLNNFSYTTLNTYFLFLHL